jgi:DNA polymerase sigma
LIKALYGLQGGGKICVVEPVPRAIVPVLKYVYWISGIECDISIENKDGI